MADKARQEELVMASRLDWTIVRLGGLTDGPKTVDYVHEVNVDASALAAVRLEPGRSFTQPLAEAGDYLYECTPHALVGIRGVVSVEEN